MRPRLGANLGLPILWDPRGQPGRLPWIPLSEATLGNPSWGTRFGGHSPGGLPFGDRTWGPPLLDPIWRTPFVYPTCGTHIAGLHLGTDLADPRWLTPFVHLARVSGETPMLDTPGRPLWVTLFR
jgi:hypothetical protein